MGINLNKIKGILLDLDDTLYSYPECNEAGKGAVFTYLSKKLKISEGKVENAHDKGRAETNKRLHGFAASHSRLLYIQSCLESLTGKTQYRLAIEAEKIFWNTFLKMMKLKPGVRHWLTYFKKIGLKVAIVTDLATDIQMRKIIHLEIEEYIDYLVTSEEAGAEKPASPIFKLALKKMELKPSEVIMIGDSVEKDIKGAEKLGIAAHASFDVLSRYF